MRKKYYDDSKENAAFERCVDVMTELILKYGPVIKRRIVWKNLMRNIWVDLVFDRIIVRRLYGYHNFNKKQKSNSEKSDAA